LKRRIFIPFYTSQPRASPCKSLLALSWYKLEHYQLLLLLLYQPGEKTLISKYSERKESESKDDFDITLNTVWN